MTTSKRSAIVWNDFQEIRYAIVDGDWSDFQGVYINLTDDDDDDELIAQLTSLVYTPENQYKIEFCDIEIFAEAIRDGAIAVECGFVP